MNQHNLFSFLVVLWLWSPIFCYSPVGCGALDIRKTKFNGAFPSHGQPFCLARSKTEFNPYRVVSNSTAIVYEEVPESSVLLSVDLGLRSGFAFYDSKGILLSFSYHRFESILTLEDSVCKLLAESSISYDITHFVLEGDAVYGAIWSTAIQNYSIERKKAVEVMYVSPAEWRERMLLKKERKSGKDAKYAAREISRQIMWKSGLDASYYSQTINTDAAEAILIGYYAVNDKLKWPISLRELSQQSDTSIVDSCILKNPTDMNIIAETVGIAYESPKGKKELKKRLFDVPLVERFSNGNVIPPPKVKEI